MQNKKWQFLNRCIVVGAVTVVATVASAQVGSTGRVSQEQTTPRTQQAGKVFVPESGKAQPALHARTTYVLHSIDGMRPTVLSVPAALETAGPQATTEEPETPQSMGCLYVQSPKSAGCVPTYGKGGPSSAGYGAIAIVDAFDNPNAASDFATFDKQWGRPGGTFIKIYANGNGSCVTPPPDANWALEESLDIEWAHVFAPKAAIILVEACSNSDTDLFYAEQVAFNFIVTNYPAGGQVTNSWQGGEFSGQTADDSFFADFNYNWTTGYVTPILAFASSGDGGFGVGYPSTNPWLISAGGTGVLRDSVSKAFVAENCWGGSGGGPSAQETYATTFTGGNTGPWADYQYPIFGQSNRVTPDLSFNADPASGVYVYSGYNGGWFIVGGTSVSSPSLASIINRSNNRLGSVFLTPITGGSDWFNNEENNLLYSQIATHTAYSTNFYDVTTGSNGSGATVNYDECTGVGSPRGLLGK